MTIGDVMVLVAPTWVAILDMWRRIILSDSDTSVNEDSIEDVEQQLDEMESEMATSEDVKQVLEMMDTLHEDVEIVHNSYIDHNPCKVQRETGECPFCTPASEKPGYDG